MSRLQLLRIALLAFLSIGPAAYAADTYVLTTIAGVPLQGFADGPAAKACFAQPTAIAAAADGTVYVADTRNFVVRKISTDGTVSTLAGTAGVNNYADGTGAAAAFNNLYGIAVDSQGNVYVTEALENTVRKISPQGVVSTIAGKSGATGSDDGVGFAARFSAPAGIAVDSHGVLYVADSGNGTIRKISTNGSVTTLAGLSGQYGSVDGTGTAARFQTPWGVAVDATGNVYVGDLYDSTIRKITPDGVVTTLAGHSNIADSVDATGTAARFDAPTGVVADANGNVYVADSTAQTLRQITPAGKVTTISGAADIRGYDDGSGIAARFNTPSGVARDAAGNLYICDTENSVVRKMAPDGTVTTYAGRRSAGDDDGLRAQARFFSPQGMAFAPNGDLYIVDGDNHVIRKMAADGTVSTVAGKSGLAGAVDGAASDARFNYPNAIAIDASGNLFIADYYNSAVRKITPAGIVSTFAGALGTRGYDDGIGSAARFMSPAGLKFDAAGDLFVCDLNANTIRKITPAGVVTTVAGQAGVADHADGAATAALFDSPAGLVFDARGNLYIADSGNHDIRKMTPDGTVTTFAGAPGRYGNLDGKGAAARFFVPTDIAIAPDGSLFVSEAGNAQIRKITSDGTVSTVAGYGYSGFGDGVGTDSWMNMNLALTCDDAGNVYVADSGNNVIRKLSPVSPDTPTSVLLNLSVRANLLANNRLIAGFVVSGPATPILVRAVGPGIAPYVPGIQTADDPRLEMYDSAENLVQSNDNWGGDSTLGHAADKVQAFPLEPQSKDAAAIRDISGLQTVHVITPNAGLALVEAYNAGDGVGSRLTNVSARYTVGAGAGSLVAGFVVSGTHQKTLLIRGVGPTLKNYAVTDALANPRISIFDSNQHLLAENDDWSPTLASTFKTVEAFDLQVGSHDAALLISLPPGVYTAQLSGAAGDTGQALVEIYDVGN